MKTQRPTPAQAQYAVMCAAADRAVAAARSHAHPRNKALAAAYDAACEAYARAVEAAAGR